MLSVVVCVLIVQLAIKKKLKRSIRNFLGNDQRTFEIFVVNPLIDKVVLCTVLHPKL